MTDIDRLMKKKEELHHMVENHCKRWMASGCTQEETRNMLAREAHLRGEIKAMEVSYG